MSTSNECVICYDYCTYDNSQRIDCNYNATNRIHNTCIFKCIYKDITDVNKAILQCPLCRKDIIIKYITNSNSTHCVPGNNKLLFYINYILYYCNNFVVLLLLFILMTVNNYSILHIIGILYFFSSIYYKNKFVDILSSSSKHIVFCSHYAYKPPTYLTL